MARKNLFHLRKHFSVYFKLYERAMTEYLQGHRNKLMRLEILTAYLEGKHPNWHLAFYLPKEEQERRNKIYKKK